MAISRRGDITSRHTQTHTHTERERESETIVRLIGVWAGTSLRQNAVVFTTDKTLHHERVMCPHTLWRLGHLLTWSFWSLKDTRKSLRALRYNSRTHVKLSRMDVWVSLPVVERRSSLKGTCKQTMLRLYVKVVDKLSVNRCLVWQWHSDKPLYR